MERTDQHPESWLTSENLLQHPNSQIRRVPDPWSLRSHCFFWLQWLLVWNSPASFEPGKPIEREVYIPQRVIAGHRCVGKAVVGGSWHFVCGRARVRFLAKVHTVLHGDQNARHSAAMVSLWPRFRIVPQSPNQKTRNPTISRNPENYVCFLLGAPTWKALFQQIAKAFDTPFATWHGKVLVAIVSCGSTYGRWLGLDLWSIARGIVWVSL